MIYHGVTLGGRSLAKVKRHPTVGDRVTAFKKALEEAA